MYYGRNRNDMLLETSQPAGADALEAVPACVALRSCKAGCGGAAALEQGRVAA